MTSFSRIRSYHFGAFRRRKKIWVISCEWMVWAVTIRVFCDVRSAQALRRLAAFQTSEVMHLRQTY